MTSSPLPGTPSDEVESVLAFGRCVVDFAYTSMSTRHPEGRDLEYLHWHCFDHRPEQFRLEEIRAAFRLVSTPECRAARAASAPRYDAIDFVMNYLFAAPAAMQPFYGLGATLREVGRLPELLPSVEQALYAIAGRVADPTIKVGADVLPWWPARGMYLMIEQGSVPAADLVEVHGVAGAWWGGAAVDIAPEHSRAPTDHQLTYLFLDDDPVAVAKRLRPVLEQRWAASGATGLLAAPFHFVDALDLARHLP